MTVSLKREALDTVGQLLISGVPGLELDEETRTFLHEADLGGVIYFAANYESPAQIAEFSWALQEARRPGSAPLWVSVDHEGGRVQRFRKVFTRLPEATDLGERCSPSELFELSERIARELAAVGVNVNFAPVADIHTNPANPVIGRRAFGTEETRVSQCVSAFVRGHLKGGVQPVLKHFPGHGDTHVDSHYALPRVDTTLETLREREFLPFARGVRSGAAMIMMAHVLLPELDTERPGTLSRRIIQNLLRGELRYSGVIFSDDMEMKAITDHYGIDTAPVLALNAGCDLLIYRSLTQARAAWDALRKAIAEDQLPPETVLEAARRSLLLKQKVLPSTLPPLRIPELLASIGAPDTAQILDRLGFKPSNP
jgi:beta-N-acetylhexosaminidase